MTMKSSNKCASDYSDAGQTNEMISLIGDGNDEHFYIYSNQCIPDHSETVESRSNIIINSKRDDNDEPSTLV